MVRTLPVEPSSWWCRACPGFWLSLTPNLLCRQSSGCRWWRWTWCLQEHPAQPGREHWAHRPLCTVLGAALLLAAPCQWPAFAAILLGWREFSLLKSWKKIWMCFSLSSYIRCWPNRTGWEHRHNEAGFITNVTSESTRLVSVEEGTTLCPIFLAGFRHTLCKRASGLLYAAPGTGQGSTCQMPSIFAQQGHLSHKSLLLHLTVHCLRAQRLSSAATWPRWPAILLCITKWGKTPPVFFESHFWTGWLQRGTENFPWCTGFYCSHYTWRGPLVLMNTWEAKKAQYNHNENKEINVWPLFCYPCYFPLVLAPCESSGLRDLKLKSCWGTVSATNLVWFLAPNFAATSFLPTALWGLQLSCCQNFPSYFYFSISLR